MLQESVGDHLRDVSDELARAFDDVPLPPALANIDVATGASTVDANTTPPEPSDLGPATERLVVLAGPGVLNHRDGLHVLASRLNVSVANTWGAKGVFPWDSPHHMGTCGLQARDFELLGFAEYDVILATGVDPHESPRDRFALTRVVEVEPAHLGDLARVIPRRAHGPRPNALFDRLAAVAQPGYISEAVPRHPARAVMDLKRSLAADSVVTADPGPVGLWIARTFPTDRPRSVFVPAVNRPAIGAALALILARRGCEAVSVTTSPVDGLTTALVAAARHVDAPMRLEVWGDDVDWSRTSELINAAGDVVAWT